MKREFINISGLPVSPFFSQAVKAGGTVYLSGIVGIHPATGKLDGDTIEAQTHRSLSNCAAILKQAGASLEDVVEVQVLLARPADFAGMNAAYAPFFPENPPARSACKLGVEIPNLLVSIRMTAVVN